MASFKALKSLCAEASRLEAQPRLEQVERLAHSLRQFRAECPPRTGETPKRLLDADSLAAQLDALRLGPPPKHLDGKLRELWTTVEHEWASVATFEKLRQEVEALMTPYSQSLSSSRDMEDKLREQEERLEALRVLADLLDELLRAS